MRKAAFLFLALGLLAACGSDQPAQDAAEQPWQPKVYGPVPELTDIGFSREDEQLKYQVSITYPGIRGDQAFNALMQQSIQDAIARFEDFIRDFEGEGRTLEGKYEAIQLSDTIVSIKQVYEWAVPGTSILLYDVHGINYDPVAKRAISLSAFFPAGREFRPNLRKLLNAKIKKQHGVAVEVRNDDLESFTIGSDYLEFYKVLYPDVMVPEPQALRVGLNELKF
jgi:hypothetical protein